MTFRTVLLLLLLAMTVSVSASASDFAKEKRWAKHIKEGLLDGEAVTLNDGKNDFFAIYMPVESGKKIGVILLHGIGVHPDWPMVVNPLRLGLPEKGWTVLSLQLPILENTAEYAEYQPLMKDVPARIEAGIKFLANKGLKKVIIIGHSLGAEMASYFIAKRQPAIEGFIGIGMNKGNVFYLPKINVPVLDLYGGEDLPGVIVSSAARKKAAAANKKYSQIKVPGADHFFNGYEKQLLAEIEKWLNR